jgi:serine/threonine-protein kinase HipA
LSLSFKGQSGGLVTAVRPVVRRVPPFFSNLLPEGHLRTYLAEHAGVKPEREFFLLAALGTDLAGAVTATPFLTEGASSAMRAKEAEQAYERSLSENALRFSLAGVQLKFSAVLKASGGLTIPAHGVGGSWIVKLPSTRFPAVPENEFVMLELARAIGITVPEIRLVPVKDIHGLPEDVARMAGNALVVRRFDREGEQQRIHMEDFAQVFGLFPDDKYGHRSYANIASVLRAEAGEDSTYEFVRRIAFSVVIGNGDMHLKNWSVLYPNTLRPVLSPAYDFVSTLVYIPGDKLALSFGGSRSLNEITVDQVRRFADTAHLAVSSVWQIVREVMERTADAWSSLDSKELLPTEMKSAIGQQIQAVVAGSKRNS